MVEIAGRAGFLRVVVDEALPAPGPPLGAVFAALAPHATGEEESALLSMAAGLATLAIETRRLYSDLRRRSEFDLLTDIHNRFSLENRLDLQDRPARETAGIFGLIYVDLDEFKPVNDMFGHHVGDQYLQEVAIRMKRQLRTVDMLARLGGDEFAVLLPSIHSRREAEEIAERLEKSFDDPCPLDGNLLRGSASVGVALYPEDGTTRDTLLNAADAAMYVAKQTRRHVDNLLAAQQNAEANFNDCG